MLATSQIVTPRRLAAGGPSEGRERERWLFARHRADGDPAAREELYRRYAPLARSLARRLRRDDLHEDLVQVADLALLKAIGRFDPERGTAFSSFAVPTIVGELKRHLRDTDWAIGVPRDLAELALRAQREATRLEAAQGRPATPAELAEALGIDLESTLAALRAAEARACLPLDAPGPADSDGAVLQPGDLDPELGHAEERAVLAPLLGRLAPRDRELLRLRFEEDLTQAEIGARLGVSQMQVSRLLRRTLVKLGQGAGEG